MLALLLAGLVAGCGRNTTKAIALEAQADNLIAAGDAVRAADTLDKALSYDGNDPGRWVKLGRVRRDLGQPSPAAAAFQQAFDLDPANIEAMQNLAVLYIAGRRFQEAKRVVDPLLSLSPNDIAGVLATGAIAYYEEDYPTALKIADEMIQLTPDSKEGYILKAHVLEKTGHPIQAARLLEQRMQTMPDDTDMGEQLLQLYRSFGNVEGVRSISIRLAKLKPVDPRYQLESLRAFQAKGAVADRERVTAYLVKRYANNPSVLGAVADFWLGALPLDEATQRIAQAAAAGNGLTKAALVGRLIRSGALDEAATLLGPVATQPVTDANVDLHAMYSNLLMAQGKVAAARDQARMTLAFDSGNDVALLTRARAHVARKEYDEAITDAQSVIADDPANESAAVLIADIYAAQGNDMLAASAYADAQSAAPRSIGPVRARTAWLIRRGRAAEAAQVAGLFARQVNRDDAWRLYETMCQAANDPFCLAQARSHGAS
ncbi:tetratricopeptide repeat protein [Sphingomonas natans]|uniref:tetratricopeptide repeat protein n=1 Tax=Sphingomonas natans TaxID=3063330 RepID=UPI0026E21C28|nr:tetratricopeptide repeat protein [Sphingomonas sp. BIUV-7]